MRAFLLFFFFLIPYLVCGQIQQPQRAEIEVLDYDENYQVIPVGKYGVLTFTQSDQKPDKENKKWLFTSYDNSFSKAWEKELLINKHFYYRDHYFDKSSLYILFGNYKEDEVKLIKLDLNSGTFETLKIDFLPKFSVYSFKVIDNSLYIDGRYKKDVVLGYINLDNRSFQLLPFEFKGTVNIESIDIDTLSKKVNVVFSNTIKKKSSILIRTYQGANQVGQIALETEGERLLSGKLTTIGDERIVVGTYSTNNTLSQGMYISKLDGNGQQAFIKFYSFTHFKNFLNYLPEKKKEKLENKISKKEAHGKEVALNYNLLVHDLIKQNYEYIMVAEAYIPTYRTETRMVTTYVNNSPVTTMQTYSVFDGWLYTHAAICGFDENGTMKWDNSFEMGDFKTYSLRSKIRVSLEKDKITLVYGTANNIRTKVISGDQVIDTKENSKLNTNYADDNVKRTYLTDIEYWYNNFFIVYGFQKIKNVSNDNVKTKRLVFYFNKIAY